MGSEMCIRDRFGPDGNLYVAGAFNDAILRFDGQTGAFIDNFATVPIDGPIDFVFVPEPSSIVFLLPLLIVMVGVRKRFPR